MPTTFIAAALIAMLAPITLVAQLTITSSPDPARVDPHSTLGFTAIVPKPSSSSASYKLRCTTSGCGYGSQQALTVGHLRGLQQLTFQSFAIPSTAKPGTTFCFDVYLPGKHVPTPSGETMTLIPDHVATTACAKVSTPFINAGASSNSGADATATQGSSPPLRSMPRTASASRSESDRAPSVARSELGKSPDLVITFVKVPVAKWIVQNIGPAVSPATQVEFRRLGVAETKTKYVGSLASGEKVEITVTPELDTYLVNSTAEVDPSKEIDEADETNNRWESKESR